MSRIYEALQKAESERQAEREVAPREQPVEPEPSFADVATDVAVETASSWPAETLAEPMPVYETLPLTGAPFNPEKIAKYRWEPLLERLPSTLERGAAVEQFRSLRSRLFELRDIKPLKTVLITSGMPQEGKSFVAVNLAISLARHKNSKVLLVDGDMRRYTLHEVLGCRHEPGLADYLAGRAEMIDVMQRAELEVGEKDRLYAMQNITFIPGGNGGDKAADLSGNPRFGELIRTASRYFDWIIVDSSPVLPVSDAVNLSRACDGVLLVARNGVTKYDVAQRAQSELKASNILGFVLNAADHNSTSVNSYYGYDAKYA
jgi:protein-tyrosine kinase